MTMMCGSTLCQPITTATGAMLNACCDAMNNNSCGAVVDPMTMPPTCVATMQPGTDDPSCPSAMSVLMMPVMGCCKPDGMTCGLRSGTLMGCVSRAQYPTAFLAAGQAPLMPATCGGDVDGGM